MHRFFFALFPPAERARQIQQAMVPFADGARMMRPERLHITLDILDDFADYPDAIAQGLIAAGSRVSAAPFDVTLERIAGAEHTIALRPRLKNAALHRLHDAIVAARVAEGIAGRPDYAFSPHITLVYRHGAPFGQGIAPIAWRAEAFVLVHSLIGQTRHDVIGHWPLAEPDAQPNLF